MDKFLVFALPVAAIGLLFSCTSDIESAEDILGKGDSSSSYLPGALVFCSNSAGCAEISAEACISFGGTIVVSCSASSSSSLAGVFGSSSSSLQSGSVFCRSADGCANMPAEACSAFGGEVVAFCPANSSSSATLSGTSGTFTDSRDGQTYRWVKIGTQTWTGENLNFNASGSKCYENLDSNCETYGRLYNWETANVACPSGWHLPSKAEWDVLGDDAKKLKATSFGGTDEYGFSALPGGLGYSHGYFNIGIFGFLWSASENILYDKGDPYVRRMSYDNERATWGTDGKSALLSVRCLQGNSTISSSSFTVALSSSSISGSSSSGSPVVVANEPVTIGTQVWMKRNLDVEVQGSKCYDNDPENCTKYGRLYDWATAMKLTSDCNSNYCSSQINSPHQGICPSGWHIPSNGDWDILMNYVGGSSVAGKKLKTTWDWYNDGNGTDDYGFSALPGGFGYSDGDFGLVGSRGDWWSASEDESLGTDAYFRRMYYSSELAHRYSFGKSYLSSVRCLQD